MSRKNILFLISNFRQGGAETQFWNLVDGLDRDIFSVHVIQVESKGRTACERSTANTMISSVYARFQLDPAVIARIVLYIIRNKIHLIQSLLFMDNQFARLSGFITNRPVVTSVRGELLPILGKKKTYIEHKMQTLSTRVVTNSHWLKDELIKGGSKESKVVVIHNGIKIENFDCAYDQVKARQNLGLPVDGKIVCIAARLHPMKDHVTFINVIQRLVQDDREVLGLIIGGGPDEADLREYVTEKRLDSNIIFAGEVTSDMAQWYSASDALLLTSVWGESFPNVIAEGMASKIPVVATDVSAVREIIDDEVNGFVVRKRDDQQMAEKTLTLLHDEECRKRIVERGMQTAASLHVSHMLLAYQKLYQSMMQDNEHS